MGNVTRPNRLINLAAERGMSAIDLVREALESEGSLDAAARKLGFSRNTLRHHLKKAGLEIEVRTVVTLREVQQ